jgi:hypothetical protein
MKVLDLILLVAVMAFVRLCVSSTMTAAKVYRPDLMVASDVAIGVLWLASLRTTRPSNDVLSRDQSLELRGLVQAHVLSYHFFGSARLSSDLPYVAARLCVAVFFFLNGLSFASAPPQPLPRRLLASALRLSLPPLLLALAAGSSYWTYYFAPLVTLTSLTSILFAALPLRSRAR